MSQKQSDLQPMTVSNLMQVLHECLLHGEIKKTDKIILSTDEEGNSHSPLVMGGVEIYKNKLVFYPILVSYDGLDGM